MVLQHGVVWVRLLLQVRVVSQVWLRERAGTVASFILSRRARFLWQREQSLSSARAGRGSAVYMMDVREQDGDVEGVVKAAKTLGGSGVWSIV